MTDRFIRITEVKSITGKSRSAIYADIAIGTFPKSILIGARSVAWVESDIAAWAKAKIDAAKPKPLPKSKVFMNEDELGAYQLAVFNAGRPESEQI